MLRSSSKKRLADELARQICSGEAGEFARLFKFTGLMAGPADKGQAAKPADPNRIGVWRREAGGTDFMRDVEQSADWPYWAQTPSLALHSDKQRVLFLGESVARGMFYDPGHTPAQVLTALLQQALGAGEVEVLDLARTNASMSTLREVAQASLQLQPDAVVIFAGNNWVGMRGYLEAGEQVYDLADSLRLAGVPGLRRRVEQLLEREITDLVDALEALYNSVGTPVYWIVPEFNLLDWRDPAITCHWLEAPDQNRRWMQLKTAARSQLRDRQYQDCLQTAREMLALDQGCSATTHYLMADCHAALGERDLQRNALENAKDAFIVDSIRSYSPRIVGLAREVLRRRLGGSGTRLIDLQEVFATHLQSEIPGRRMFLDYCHLTSEAIAVAMTAVARRILSESPTAQGGLLPQSTAAPQPSRKVEADAHLLAAIHNAHWGQSLEVVTYYCMRAAALAPEVLEVMRAFVDIQNRRTPTWMNGKVVELLDAMSPQVKRYLFSMEFKCLDRLLFEAFAICCSNHGKSLSPELDAIRREQHSVAVLRKIDLLDPYYHSTSFSNQQLIEGGLDQRNNFFKAYQPLSEFCFIADRLVDVVAMVTLRLSPWAAAETKAEIRVNGNLLLAAAAGKEWASWHFTIPKELLREGVNELKVSWPELAADSVAPLVQICTDIERQQVPPLYPTYGDIHTLTVRCQ